MFCTEFLNQSRHVRTEICKKNDFKSTHHGEIPAYKDRIHQYLCPVKILLSSMQC